ncbi:hypothetical protein [Streptomyces hypolithicus]
MAGLTAGALAAIGLLAHQAASNAPSPAQLARPGTYPSTQAAARPEAADKQRDPLALPAKSGKGTRVVYALGGRRVWLVDEQGRPTRTFAVMPSTVSPQPGTYAVTSRSGSITGSDGVRIEHVVRFANVDDVSIGFSAAVDGSMPQPDPKAKTGGVRMARADGNAMWRFATVRAQVVVVR